MQLNGSSMNVVSPSSKITLPKINFSKMNKWMKSKKSKTSGEKQREEVVKRAVDHLEKMGYKVLKEIGEGTYGNVLAIRSSYMKTKLALKIVMRDRTWDMETSAWQTFDHPNILPLVDTISLPEAEMYLMPCHPKDLNQMLEKQKFRKSGFRVVQGWLKETLSGLAYLHSRQFCHLDLKAANVLVTSSNTAVLCDFSCINVTTERTRMYGLMRHYHPPEVCMSSGEYLDVDGEAFDMWSFGLFALNLFTNHWFNHWFEFRLTEFQTWEDDVYPLLFEALQLPKFHRLLKRTFMRSSVTEGQAEAALNLIQGTLRLNEKDRPRASDLLLHTLFKEDSGKVLDGDRMWNSNHEGCFQKVNVLPPVVLDKDDKVSLIQQPAVLHDDDRGKTRAVAGRSIGQDFEPIRDDLEFTEGEPKEESWPRNRPIHIEDVFTADEPISTENSVCQPLVFCNNRNQAVPEDNYLIDNIHDDVRMLMNDMLTALDFQDVTIDNQNQVIPDKNILTENIMNDVKIIMDDMLTTVECKVDAVPKINLHTNNVVNDVKLLMNDMLSTVEMENVIICNGQTHDKNESGISGLAQENDLAPFQENFADFSVFENDPMYCGPKPRNTKGGVIVQNETVDTVHSSHSMETVEIDGAARKKKGNFIGRFGAWIRKKFSRKSKG